MSDEILKGDPSLNQNSSFLRIPASQVHKSLFCSYAIDNVVMDQATSENVLYDYNGSTKSLIGMQSSTICLQNPNIFHAISTCYIVVISSLSFYEDTFIANAVIYDMFEQNPVGNF